jgi:hypothetical protein
MLDEPPFPDEPVSAYGILTIRRKAFDLTQYRMLE